MSIFSNERDYPETNHRSKTTRKRGTIGSSALHLHERSAEGSAKPHDRDRKYLSYRTQLDEHLTHEVQQDRKPTTEVLDLASLLDPESLHDIALEAYGGRSEYQERVQRICDGAMAPATLARIASATRQLHRWAAARNVSIVPMSVRTGVLLITDMIDFGYSVSSIRTYFATIRKMHRAAGEPHPLEHPLIRGALRMARRSRGDNPERKSPFLAQDVRASLPIAKCDPVSARGVRDFALLAVGHAGALRRGELVGMRWEHLDLRSDGFDIFIPRSKTDQYAAGVRVHVGATGSEWCPHRALSRLQRCMAAASGPVFRRVYGNTFDHDAMHGQQVTRLVKRYAEHVGHDPREFGGHSLRVGFITDAFDNEVADIDVMRHVRHLNPETTYAYYRPRMSKNLTKAVGL